MIRHKITWQSANEKSSLISVENDMEMPQKLAMSNYPLEEYASPRPDLLEIPCLVESQYRYFRIPNLNKVISKTIKRKI